MINKSSIILGSVTLSVDDARHCYLNNRQGNSTLLYDKKGHAVHIHRVITLPGGRKVDQHEIERRAFERAKTTGRDISGLESLHLSTQDFDESFLYRVDVTTRTLVKTQRQTDGKTMK